MSVQNFLEDEDYEPDEQPTGVRSSVPDFLQDEDYDEVAVDEYYGGGFSEGTESSSSHQSADSGFGGYENDEEELFDGVDPFDAADEEDGESAPSYGISGLPSRAPVARTAAPRVDTTTEQSTGSTPGGTTTSPSMGTSVATEDSDSDSFVPNFLADEDEDELPVRGGGNAPVPTPSSATPSATPSAPNAKSSSRAASTGDVPSSSNAQKAAAPALSSDGGAPSTADSQETPRARRDLSKRPQQTVASPRSESTPSSGGVPVSAPAQASRPAPSAAVAQRPPGTAPAPSTPRDSVPTTTVRFDPKAAAKPVTGEEAEELRAPSSYAASRNLKFTALNQKDATVRKVGADGLTPAERARAASAAAAEAIRTPTNGKLSKEELLFYANLGAQRSADFGTIPTKKLFIPPMLEESPEQKRAREARINRALAGGSIARGAKTRLTEKDYRVLQFIAIFKFASERQIGKLLSVGEHAAYKRLNNLRKHGLTKGFKTLGVKGSVWVLTETGMDLSGFELPRGTESALTLSMVSHQFTVNHVASHLWAGGANVLREKNFPQRNLPDGAGGFEFGERLISELQIQSAFGKVRGNTKADAYVPQIKRQMANLFDNWQRAGGSSYGPSPELIAGNEHMWTLFPPVSNRLNYHVPDLVVARPRDADGKPQSIAVEVELRTKADDSSYERTLDAYRADDRIYRKVVWICRLKGTAEKLTRIAKRNGLADQGRIAIVPIYMEDGSRFTGKDTWSL